MAKLRIIRKKTPPNPRDLFADRSRLLLSVQGVRAISQQIEPTRHAGHLTDAS
jgi:hypothetical protein